MLVVFSSCSNWAYEGHYALYCDNYYDCEFTVNMGEEVRLGDSKKLVEKKATSIRYISKDSNYTLLQGKTSTAIMPHITQAVSDGNYILVEQVPLDSICKCNTSCFFLYAPNTTPTDCDNAVADAINKKEHLYYHIIDEYKNIIYGPYDKKDYDSLRVALNIPDKLRFRKTEPEHFTQTYWVD